ncbi:MAG: electron transport complex subunit RsxC [Planctomycetota bacterium]|nr:MAG: electron transport complex subunit RsxC [Planctomycetota bacterium]
MMIKPIRDRLYGRKFFPRGVQPPCRKEFTEREPIGMLIPKQELKVPLIQHIGAVCDALVKPREEVSFGQKIADADAPISAPIHASVTGKTGMATVAALPNGLRVPTIPITPAAEQENVVPANFLQQYMDRNWDSVEPNSYEPEAICEAIREGGVVGLGGATFPTHFKLKRSPDRPVDTVVLNGCECEPYLTSDHRLMVEAPEPIVVGLQLAVRAIGAQRAIIAIEHNKPDAIEIMRKVVKDRPNIEVAVCATKYPMGGERQLIPAVLGRIVPSAPKGLPLDVGVVMVNVATAHSIARAVVRNQPLTHRVVTVTGRGVAQPGNWLVPIGTIFSELIEACGGVTDRALKVLAGGPMMGPTVPNLNVPVTKGVGGITVMIEEETVHWKESPCIRCAKCVDFCPLHLSPTKIAHAVKFRDYFLANKYDMNACCECGCCSYICPANIPLAQYIRAGKLQWRLIQAQGQKS